MDELFDKPVAINEAMRQALARMYADKDMREFLIRTTQAANQNSVKALDAGKPDLAMRFANRATAWQDLLEKGKQNFIHFEAIKKSLKDPLKNAKVEEVKL